MKVSIRQVPRHVRSVASHLHRHKYEAYVVGGAVRDLVLRRKPKDWDLATDASPSKVQKLFQKTLATGKRFGTITVRIRGLEVQVTTYRTESTYSDRRRPSKVLFTHELEADLSRRDFTMNALALHPKTGEIIDPFKGRRDLKNSCLRSVGSASDRFKEDTLRAVRAGRFIAELHLKPTPPVTKAARQVAPFVRKLSGERIRDELNKLLMSRNPSAGLLWLEKTGILQQVLPEVLKGKRVYQGGWHHYDVYHHTLRAVDLGPADLTVRLALLLHDIAKPMTRTRDHRGYHFYGHDKKGAQLAEKILRRLRYSNRMIAEVATLIRYHLFEADALANSDAALRRFMRKVGEPLLPLFIEFRKADAKACGPGHGPSKDLSAIQRRARKIQKAKDALHRKDLKIDGNDVIRWMKIPPGPQVGIVLDQILQDVLKNPKTNQRTILRKMILGLGEKKSRLIEAVEGGERQPR